MLAQQTPKFLGGAVVDKRVNTTLVQDCCELGA
jgi:hypothetical protein